MQYFDMVDANSITRCSSLPLRTWLCHPSCAYRYTLLQPCIHDILSDGIEIRDGPSGYPDRECPRFHVPEGRATNRSLSQNVYRFNPAAVLILLFRSILSIDWMILRDIELQQLQTQDLHSLLYCLRTTLGKNRCNKSVHSGEGQSSINKNAPPESTYHWDQLLWLGTRIERLHQWCIQHPPISHRRTRVFIRSAWHGHADRRAQTWRNAILSYRPKSGFCVQMAGIIQQPWRFSVVVVLGSRWYVQIRGRLRYTRIGWW